MKSPLAWPSLPPWHSSWTLNSALWATSWWFILLLTNPRVCCTSCQVRSRPEKMDRERERQRESTWIGCIYISCFKTQIIKYWAAATTRDKLKYAADVSCLSYMCLVFPIPPAPAWKTQTFHLWGGRGGEGEEEVFNKISAGWQSWALLCSPEMYLQGSKLWRPSHWPPVCQMWDCKIVRWSTQNLVSLSEATVIPPHRS